jgi:hypothetical protein
MITVTQNALQFVLSVTLTLSCFPLEAAEEEAAADEDELAPPAFMYTGADAGRSLALFASSATRRATSIVSPQCLHFFATWSTDSPQKGHVLLDNSVVIDAPGPIAMGRVGIGPLTGGGGNNASTRVATIHF